MGQNLTERNKMKRLIIATVLVLSFSAQATELERLINDNTQDTFKQIETLRSEPKKKDNYPVFSCNFKVTDEKNPRKKWKTALDTSGVDFHEDRTTYIYYDEDSTGSTVIYVYKKSNSATIITQNSEGDILSTGESPKCTKIN
jgi:hypothetical protein